MYNIDDLNMDGEIWKDIPGYSGLYQASNLGRIKGVEGRVTYSVRHGVRRWKEKILKPKNRNNLTPGYIVCLWKDKKCGYFKVARLVAMTFIGMPIGDINTVNHIDGNRLNNRIENLEWLTRAENIKHAFRTGLMPKRDIKLFNDTFEKTFSSMTKASSYIGRGDWYVSSCLRENKRIIGAGGVHYEAEIVT